MSSSTVHSIIKMHRNVCATEKAECTYWITVIFGLSADTAYYWLFCYYQYNTCKFSTYQFSFSNFGPSGGVLHSVHGHLQAYKLPNTKRQRNVILIKFSQVKPSKTDGTEICLFNVFILESIILKYATQILIMWTVKSLN